MNRNYIPVTMRREKAEAELRRRIGAAISQHMVAAGKTQADLAAAAEIDDSQLSKVLAGTVGLSLFSIYRIAAALGVPARELLPAGLRFYRGTPVNDQGRA